MSLALAIEVLWSHWRRKPGQFLTLIIGLSLATGLWTGVQAINSEARHSYDQAASAIKSSQFDRLERKDGKSISLEIYVRLQRSGWYTSPVLEGTIETGSGSLTILGIDPVTMPRNPIFDVLRPGGSKFAEILNSGNQNSNGVAFASGHTLKQLLGNSDLPEILATKGIPDGTLMMDISLAKRLLGRRDEISRLTVHLKQSYTQPELSSIAPDLMLIKAEQGSGVERLTDSFHLNLTAFGLLAFVVGLFIVHGTIGLVFEQRRNVFRTLRVLGLSARSLVLALLIELLAIAVLAGTLGVVIGYGVAALLLPDVAATLRGLYGAQVDGVLAIRAEWWLSGFAIAVGGTLIAAGSSLIKLVRLPILASAQPRAWAMASSRSMPMQVSASVLLLGSALLMGVFGNGLVIGFGIIGAVLVGAALLLPPIMRGIFVLLENWSSGPLAQWFWADTRQQLPGLSLALMALLLALAANIGVSTMVGSFRTTFTGWLDQRLVSEVYVRAKDKEQAESLVAWLEPRVDAILPIWNVDADLNGQKGKIYGISDHATYRQHWPLLTSVDDVWNRVAIGDMLLINEQMARKQKLELGDKVELENGQALPIGGIYSDYGNPQPQVMVSIDLLLKWHPNVEKLRYAVRIEPERVSALIKEAHAAFALKRDGMVDQSAIKSFSVQVFERTFSVTHALNLLTLSVAGFAIFTSLLTLATMRLPQLAPVWALGLTRRHLALLELARTIMLAFFTGIFALPLGLTLAWLLLSVVNVEAFGWKLPMTVFAGDWIRLWLFALVAACLAAAIPARRIARIAPSELAKVFAHER